MYRILFQVILLIGFSEQAYSLSCLEPVDCSLKPAGAERDICELTKKVDTNNSLVDSKISAEACVLGNKLNRRQFIQSQCKTRINFNSGLCGIATWECVPNGNAGEVYHLGRKKLYSSADEVTAGPTIIHDWDSRELICEDGNWIPLAR